MSTATKTARELAHENYPCVATIETWSGPDGSGSRRHDHSHGCDALTAAIETRDAEHEAMRADIVNANEAGTAALSAAEARADAAEARNAEQAREWSETCLKWAAQLDAAEAAAKFEKHHGDLARDMNVALESANGGMLDALRNIVLRAEHGRDDKETHGPAARLIFRAIVEVCERAIATPGETPATTVSVQTPTAIARLTESDFVKMLAQLHVPAADARHWFAAYLERDATTPPASARELRGRLGFAALSREQQERNLRNNTDPAPATPMPARECPNNPGQRCLDFNPLGQSVTERCMFKCAIDNARAAATTGPATVERGHCSRCDRCGWEFSADPCACYPGNCSMRPLPELRSTCAGCGAPFVEPAVPTETTGPATCELCEGKGGYDRSCPRCDAPPMTLAEVATSETGRPTCELLKRQGDLAAKMVAENLTGEEQRELAAVRKELDRRYSRRRTPEALP